MAKTKTPITRDGIHFVPTNCYAPTHWKVKQMMFPFSGFDTRSEYEAANKAALANQIAHCLQDTNQLENAEVTINCVIKMIYGSLQ